MPIKSIRSPFSDSENWGTSEQEIEERAGLLSFDSSSRQQQQQEEEKMTDNKKQQQQQQEEEDEIVHVNQSARPSGRPRYPLSKESVQLARQLSKSINLRDIGAIEECAGIRRGQIFRSSEIISHHDMANFGIKSVLDLRKPPATCTASARNIGQTINRIFSAIVVWFRHTIFRKRTKLKRTLTLVSEEVLEEYPRCLRCSNMSEANYGTHVDVYHVDLLPSLATYWIFYELPLYIKAKIMLMKLRGKQPDHMVADAVADPGVMGYVKLYKIILRSSKKQIAHAFRIFIHNNHLPAIVHCQHGKDRTGLVVMLLYLLCNVPRGVIIRDYAVSEVLLREGRQNNELRGMPESLTTDRIISSAEEVMERTLDFLDEEFGGAVGYLTSAGMSLNEISNLQVALCSMDDDS